MGKQLNIARAHDQDAGLDAQIKDFSAIFREINWHRRAACRLGKCRIRHPLRRSWWLLKIHADFNLHPYLKVSRRVNLFVYLNPDWLDSYGGHLEMWSRDMKQCLQRISPTLGRVVIFSSSAFSHHGHPNPLTPPPGRVRRSIAQYYYTGQHRQPQEDCMAGECWQP